jgi:hypothetical protein
MLKRLSKRQLHSLLNFLDTLSTLNIAPGYSIIWEHRPRTVLDMYWNITREDPQSIYAVSVRDELGSLFKCVLDIREDDR